MNHDQQQEEFRKLTTRARNAGLLKFCSPADGIAIIGLPPAADASPALPAVSATPEPVAATSAPSPATSL